MSAGTHEHDGDHGQRLAEDAIWEAMAASANERRRALEALPALTLYELAAELHAEAEERRAPHALQGAARAIERIADDNAERRAEDD